MIVFVAIIIGILILLVLKINENDKANTDKTTVTKTTSQMMANYDKVIVLNDSIDNGIFPYVAFDNKNKKVTIQQSTLPIKEINYDDIMGIELIEDGSTSLSYGNIIGGSILAGEAGAIIGGMNKKDTVNYLSSKISINDFQNPSYEIIMIRGAKIKKSDKAYTVSIQKLTEVMDTIKYIINNKQTI